LRVVPLEPIEWTVVIGLAAIPATVGQILKSARS
jgi:hypothetical protein